MTPCIHFNGGIITYANAYKYKGFAFEYHPYLGPTKIKKDGELAKRQGRKFYKVINEWEKLSAAEKKSTLI